MKKIKMSIAKGFEKFIPGHNAYFLSVGLMNSYYAVHLSGEDKNEYCRVPRRIYPKS